MATAMFPMASLRSAPRFETQKALLLLDLQNDFVSEEGKLFVDNTTEFLHKIPPLVRKFREKGHVMWVQTEFRGTRLTARPDLASYGIIVASNLQHFSNQQLDGDEEATGSVNGSAHDHPRPASPSVVLDRDDPEPYLSERSTTDFPRCCLPGTVGCAMPEILKSAVDAEKDRVLTKVDYSAFHNASLIQTMRMNLITEIYLCGSLSNISIFATALDAVRYGLQVTIIEDCVGYRDPKIHHEAMRQMADSMGADGVDFQELLDDLSGMLGDVVTESTFQSMLGASVGGSGPEQYSMRKRAKESDKGAGIVPSIEEPDKSEQPPKSDSKPDNLSAPPVPGQKRTNDTIGSDAEAERSSPNAKASRIRIRRSPVWTNPDTTAETQRKSASPCLNVRDVSDSQLAIQHSPSLPETDISQVDNPVDEMPSITEKARAIGRTLRGTRESQPPSAKVLGPGDFIGERDSRIIYDFLSENADETFARLRRDDDSREVRWQKMFHRSGEVPRLVAVQGVTEADGSMPIYRHPADESPPLTPFSPTVQRIRQDIERAIGHPVNHVLIQLYRSGEDNISEHSDKTLDIVRGSFIVNVSLGAKRVMTLRTKKAGAAPRPGSRRASSVPLSGTPPTSGTNRTAQRIPLPHNSLFVLGQDTNQIWLHAIRADKRRAAEKSPEELAFNQERISLTFRHIGTHINPRSGLIWGQGATGKTRQEAKRILNGAAADKEGERMIRAFGQENHQSQEFSWDAQYGAGFDVVDFKNEASLG